MVAGLGGYATTLMDRDIECWVINVVPLSGPNTLPMIHDRGLITYPRTYDLLHASGLFSAERKRYVLKFFSLPITSCSDKIWTHTSGASFFTDVT